MIYTDANELTYDVYYDVIKPEDEVGYNGIIIITKVKYCNEPMPSLWIESMEEKIIDQIREEL